MIRTMTERRLVTGGNSDSNFPVPPDEAFGDEDAYLDSEPLNVVLNALIETRGAYAHLQAERLLALWKRKGGKSEGGPALAKATKPSGLLAHFADYTWVIWVGADYARDLHLTAWQMEALLAHELRHCGENEDTGKPEYVGHDVETFAADIVEYGLWRQELEQLGTVVQARLWPVRESLGALVDTGVAVTVAPAGTVR